MKHVAGLVLAPEGSTERKIVVLSAVSGTTNSLVAIAEACKKGEAARAEAEITVLNKKYSNYIAELYTNEAFQQKAQAFVESKLELLRHMGDRQFGQKEEKTVLAQGELVSTQLMQWYLESQNIPSVLLPALTFMKTVEKEPDNIFIKEELGNLLGQYPRHTLFITQGYICRNEHGETDNLQRGGSDYSASLIGIAAAASEIQIWTDIDGMHNNDPRVVDRTYPIHEMSFDEAAELAYFGAKILHPASVLPAQKGDIPVRLLNTMQPEARGTLITANPSNIHKITAVAAKEGIVAIKIKSSRMLLAYGFLRKVFEVFEKYKTPIDVITTSEVAVSLTIDDTSHLEAIFTELKGFGTVEFDSEQAIVCVVGHFLQLDTRIAITVLQILKDIPIRMISYGGSKHNITMVMHKDFKQQALQKLNDGLFYNRELNG